MATPYSNIDIVLFGLFRWDGPYSSISIAMAKEFARNNRVFYISHPYTYGDKFKGQLPKTIKNKGQWTHRQEHERLHIVQPPLGLPINWLSPGPIYNALRYLNDRRFKNCLQQLINQFNIKQYLFINCFDPFYGRLLPTPAPLAHIYQCVDDISQSDYTAKHGTRLEDQAIQNADLTLVTSSELYRLKKHLTPNIHILNNAADTRIFNQAVQQSFDCPEDLRDLRQPLIGYIGNLDALRVDYSLLKKIAQQHPAKTLVLVGPINNDEYRRIGLDQLPNVRFTGGKPIEHLPAYLQHFDCTLIPFHCNTLTKSIYPLKINEYLAAGKAVVSTAFSEDISSFKPYIYLADSHASFIHYIDHAIQANSEAQIKERMAVAQRNTWEARIEQFWQILTPILPQIHPKALEKPVTNRH